MTVHYEGNLVTLHHGDCLDVLRSLPDNSVDSVVTDPPYGLGFMGKDWDDLPPGLPWAQECLRVLKPGGHLLAFGGTRTWHRLACAVEDAGFEVRDSIAWLYGSGFPKSLDVSKAIDKLDAADERRARALRFTAWMRSTGITSAQINAATGTNMGGHYLTDAAQPAVAVADLFDKLRPLLPEVPADIEALVAQRTVESQNFAARAVVGVQKGAMAGWNMDGSTKFVDRDLTDAHTAEAKAWQGWGTALKPAFEPVVVARKPLTGTVAANVLAHGVGALNIDACRVGTSGGGTSCGHRDAEGKCLGHANAGRSTSGETFHGPDSEGGRWPANVVLDEDAAAELDRQSGRLHTQATNNSARSQVKGATDFGSAKAERVAYGKEDGGASRFFYVAKAPTKERPKADDGTAHPTVKPLTLMRWLVRLVTPPGGVVLEPFAGSGTTVEACLLEGFRCVAIEREPTYLPLIEQRIRRVMETPPEPPPVPTLFDEEDAA